MPDPRRTKGKKSSRGTSESVKKIMPDPPNPKKTKKSNRNTSGTVKKVNKNSPSHNEVYVGRIARGPRGFVTSYKTPGSNFTMNRGGAFSAVHKKLAKKKQTSIKKQR